MTPDENLRGLMAKGHSFHQAVKIMCLGNDDTPADGE
jgi:hypothetical protein